MKGGSLFCRRGARNETMWPGVERPCSVGIWSERVEARGGGRPFYLDACGRLGRRDETSERGRLCGVSLVRSSRRQPSTTECPGGDDLPQGGVVTSICDVAEQMAARTLESVNGEKKMTGGQN